jgi:hypothetical protein
MLWLVPCPDASCGALAEISDRITIGSTDGPVEHVRTLCLDGHHFFMPASRVPPTPALSRPVRSDTSQSG